MRGWVGLSLLLVSACVAVTRADDTTAEPSAPTVTTFALLPPHNRMQPAHAGLDELISLRVTGELQRAGLAVSVSRDYLGPILNEKAMVRADMSDAVALSRPHRLIGADVTAFTTIDRIEGELIVTTDLIPADQTDVADPYGTKPKLFPRVQSRGDAACAAAIITEHAQAIGQELGNQQRERGPAPDANPQATDAALPSGLRVGAMAIAVYPAVNEAWPAVMGDVAANVLCKATGLQRVEREALDKVLAEHEMAWAGLTLRDRSQRVGVLASAELMMLGGVVVDGARCDVELQLLDVATGAVIASVGAQQVEPEQTMETAASLGEALAAQAAAGWARVRALEVSKPAMAAEGLTLAVRAAQLLYYGTGDREACEVTARWLTEAALDLSPDSPETLGWAGLTSLQLGEYDAAERRDREQLRLAPDSAAAEQQLGMLLDVHLNRSEEALPHLQRALKLDESDGKYMWRRVYVARCLLRLGRGDEALPLLQEAEANWNDNWLVYELLGDVYAARQDWAAAAPWYEKAAMFETTSEDRWARALEAYRKAGDQSGSAHMVEMLTRSGGDLERDDWDRVLPMLARAVPEDAAALCYRLIGLGRDAALAQRTLEQLGYPADYPAITGPVFDVESLRRRGVFIVLQPYTDFRYPNRLGFMAQFIEDTLGVPVRVAQVPAEQTTDYKRNPDRLDPHLATDKALGKLGMAQDATALVALTSLDMSGSLGTRWAEDPRHEHVGRGLVTSAVFDEDVAIFEHDDQTLASVSMAGLQRATLKYVALCLMPPGEARAKDCLANLCPLSKWHGDNDAEHLLREPCVGCRHQLQSERPEWLAGPMERAPIEAGPQTAALDSAATPRVLLLGIGDTAEALSLNEAARVIEASTGMRVTVQVHETMPRLTHVDNEYPRTDYDDVLAWCTSQEAGRGFDAACVVVADNMLGTRRMLSNWHLLRPGQVILRTKVPDDLPCPFLIVPLGHDRWAHWSLMQTLRRTRPIRLGDETVEASGYATLLVGGLTVAARDKDVPCWTYGCPGTVWHDLTPIDRASPWLCDDCRKTLQNRFQEQP